MKTLSLTPETKINAILVVDKKENRVCMSTDMDMSLLEWTIQHSMSNKVLEFGELPNFLNMVLKYNCDGSNETHKMSGYLYQDKKYTVFVNVFDK
jgi:hypothetical protein